MLKLRVWPRGGQDSAPCKRRETTMALMRKTLVEKWRCESLRWWRNLQTELRVTVHLCRISEERRPVSVRTVP
eukprot:9631245-Prorocentrum_lima.AAC.1